MKKYHFIYLVVFLALLLGCKKPPPDVLPEVTVNVASVNQTSVKLLVSAPSSDRIQVCKNETACITKFNDNQAVEFTFAGLLSDQTYYFEITSYYSQQQELVQKIEVKTKPIGVTLLAQEIELHSALVSGEIFSEENIEYYFQYGFTNNINTVSNKTENQFGKGLVNATLTDLRWGSDYSVRLVLKIDGQLFPGEFKRFTTLGTEPELSDISFIRDNLSTIRVSFKFKGNLLPCNVTLKSSGAPSSELVHAFSSSDTAWHDSYFDFPIQVLRTYGINLKVSNDLGFAQIDTIINSPAFIYQDFVYNWVQIGDRKWTVESFRGKKYANGDPIPYIYPYSDFSNQTQGAMCYPNNDESLVADYGALYNFYVVEDERGIAPPGWRVPNEEDVVNLKNISPSAANLKEKGFDYWEPPNTNANNSTGFSARGSGGIRDGYYGSFKLSGVFLVDDIFMGGNGAFYLHSNSGYIQYGFSSKKDGFSIRFVL